MKLEPRQLGPRCDPADLRDALERGGQDSTVLPGQHEALEAIDFAASVPHGGFNAFVIGEPATGKLEATRSLLSRHAARLPAPDDLCYINCFGEPARPARLSLPAGWGPRLRDALALLVDELRTAIPAVFESEEYHSRVAKIDGQYAAVQEKTFGELIAEARSSGIALWRTPAGFSFAPARNGDAMPPDEFEGLTVEEKARLSKAIETLQQRLERLMRQVVGWRRERREALRKLDREVTVIAVGNLVDDMIRQFLPISAAVALFEAVRRDVIENAVLFQQSGDSPTTAEALSLQPEVADPARRYRVNVLVSHAPGGGAPVVVEENPAFPNLVGRIEYLSRFGALVTDFGMIKAGAMHRATGGYLLLDARRLLAQPFAWDALKRALFSREIRVESLGQQWGLASPVTLEPQPIPFEAKVVLFGDRRLYLLLQEFDPDFSELFKIAPEFADVSDRSTEAVLGYARWIVGAAHEAGLRPFREEAIAKVIDWSSRVAGDAQKLSLELRRVKDLLVESDHWAGRSSDPEVRADHVDRALAARLSRSGEVKRRLHESILNRTLLIDTEGLEVAQVNGLAILSLGEASFGLPTRITATTRVGDGSVVDIQRESELGGALHTKGVMILAAYLASRYSAREPLSLSASLVFEQTYGEVDGDSASLAELCALLSSLSGLPLLQSLAVTGSVNQHGVVQAIGGVNEKIEGFFELCMARPSAEQIQGVIIPASNARHLALRDEVIDSVGRGRFNVIAVESVDQAMAWLVDGGALPAPDPATWSRRIDDRIRARLREYARLRQRFTQVAAERASRRR
jgi:predicted ATP-dependent protease